MKRPTKGPTPVGLVAALFTLGTAPLGAQEPAAPLQEVTLIDGSTLFGHVVVDGDPLVVRLVSGDEMRIARARVRAVARARGSVREGEFWREDPNLTRLFWAPTARTLPSGEGYLAAYELAFPYVAVGAGDHLMLAGGTHLFGDLTDDRVFYFAPKLRLVSGAKTDLAVGAIGFWQIGNSSDALDVGAVYAVVTSGTPDQAVSFAVGAGWDEGGFASQAIVMAGGEFRTSRTIKLVTENYLGEDAALLAFGPRFFGERLSADLAIGLFIEHGDTFTFPIVNFAYVW